MYLPDERNSLQEKVEEALLEREENVELLELLKEFCELLDSQLCCTYLTEHAINAGDSKPVILPPNRTSPMKKKMIDARKGYQSSREVVDALLRAA